MKFGTCAAQCAAFQQPLRCSRSDRLCSKAWAWRRCSFLAPSRTAVHADRESLRDHVNELFFCGSRSGTSAAYTSLVSPHSTRRLFFRLFSGARFDHTDGLMRTWEVSSVLARRKMNARTLPYRHPQVSRISIRRNWLVEPPTCRTPAKPVSLLTAQAALLGALPVPLCVDACGCDGDSGDSTNWMRSKRKLAVWPSTPWQAEDEVWPTKQPLLTSAAYPQAGRLPVSIIFSIGRTFA